MNVIIWTQPDCPKCEAVKEHFTAKGCEIELRSAEGLVEGDEFNPEALKWLAKQNHAVPLVFVDGMYCKDALAL